MAITNTNKKYALIGCDMLKFNEVLTDTNESYTIGEAIDIAGLASFSFNPNVATATMYGDDQVYDTAVGNGDLSVSVGVPDIFPELEALLYGHTYDAATGELLKGDPNPKSICIRLRLKKNNGAFRLITIFSAKASEGATDVTGKQGNVSFTSRVIDFLATPIFKNKKYMRVVDSDDVNVKLNESQLMELWFGDDPLKALTTSV